MKAYKILLFSLLALLFTNCAEEDPDLITPPTQVESIYVRFFNFASDKQPRTLAFDNEESLPADYQEIIEAMHPPVDSAFMGVNYNGSLEIQKERIFKFSRNLTYNFIALPSKLGAEINNPVDTLVVYNTSKTIMPNDPQTYLRLFNANPDTTVRYTMRFGCPNGNDIVSNVNYRQISSMKGIRAGTIAVSIIRLIKSDEETIGLFRLDSLKARGQYTIYITQGEGEEEKVMLLDELDHSINALTKPSKIEEKLTYVRPMNFSKEVISFQKNPDETIAENLDPLSYGAYIPITACNSMEDDVLGTYYNGNLTNETDISLEVLSDYSLAVLDSKDKTAPTHVIIPPITDHDYDLLENNAAVRVINGDYIREVITLSQGAVSFKANQDATGNPIYQMESGIVLADKLNYGELSKRVYIKPGNVPINVFWPTEPAKLLNISNLTLEAGKEYIIAVIPATESQNNVYLIEQSEENKTLTAAPESAFIQLIHACAGVGNTNVSLDDLLIDANINYTGSLGTSISAGNHNFTFNGSSFDFDAVAGKRYLLIASGSKDNVDIFDLEYDKIDTVFTKFNYRAIHAATDVETLSVTDVGDINEELTDADFLAKTMQYKEAYRIKTDSIPKSFVFRFYDQAANYLINEARNENFITPIKKADDIQFALGTSHSIIFCGNKNSGYEIIIVQEF